MTIQKPGISRWPLTGLEESIRIAAMYVEGSSPLKPAISGNCGIHGSSSGISLVIPTEKDGKEFDK